MPELIRPRSGASKPGTHQPAATSTSQESEGAATPEVDAAEEQLAVALAALEAATRKVRIAELLQSELPSDAKDSAQADAEDRLLAAVAKYEAAERACHRAEVAQQHAQAAAEQAQIEADQPATVYPDADDWLRSWLLPVWRRPDRQHWCSKWWLHAEAVSRLEAIWRAWEALRLDGTLGPSVWWRDHADYHLAVLTSDDGPFSQCHHEKQRHRVPEAFAAVPNPVKLDQYVG